MADDQRFMERAIDIAARHHPHPNPRVGCVLVSADGRVVGEGAHRQAGTAHAEQLALDAAGSDASGSTAYVTLEPCSHHGATPPCADALIDAGVGRVIVATTDPDERVQGTGIRRLTEAGIPVSVGMLETEAIDLDAGYFHHRRTGRPRLHVVLTASVPGGLSEAANRDLDVLRDSLDYVVGGSGDLLHHPAAANVSLGSQLAALGAEGIVDLGVRDDAALVQALEDEGLIDVVTAYTIEAVPDWQPLRSIAGFTIAPSRTIGPEFRHHARKAD